MEVAANSDDDEYDLAAQDRLVGLSLPTDESCQLGRIWTRVKAKIKARTIAESGTPGTYAERLVRLEGLLWGLQYACRDALRSNNTDDEAIDGDGVIWVHQDPLGWKATAAHIARAELEEACAAYLSASWAQDDELDWIFMDALIFFELTEFTYSLNTRAFLGPEEELAAIAHLEETPQQEHDRNLRAMWASVGARYIAPTSLVAVIYWLGYEQPAAVAAWIYAAYLALRVLLWPARYLRRRKNAEKEEHLRAIQLEMIRAYYQCQPPTIHPRSLTEQITRARTMGAVWPASALAILDRITARDSTAFVPGWET